MAIVYQHLKMLKTIPDLSNNSLWDKFSIKKKKKENIRKDNQYIEQKK